MPVPLGLAVGSAEAVPVGVGVTESTVVGVGVSLRGGVGVCVKNGEAVGGEGGGAEGTTVEIGILRRVGPRHLPTRRTSPTRRAPTPCTTLYDASYSVLSNTLPPPPLLSNTLPPPPSLKQHSAPPPSIKQHSAQGEGGLGSVDIVHHR